MRFPLLTLIAVLAPCTLADVEFVTPAKGGTLGSGAVTVTWKESGTSPAITTLTTYTLQLMVGGNEDDNSQPLYALTATGAFSAGNSLTANIPVGVAGPTANGFYLKMTSVASEGGTIINFSDRFSMPSLTGQTPAAFVQAAAALNGDATGRETVNDINPPAAAAGGGAAAGAGAFGTPYNSQTGLTKYAPMQPIPPTKITANNFTPLFTPSSYVIATTWVAHPSILTTVTASQTFSVSSMENTAQAQSNPSGDMAKFLARWKD